MRKSRAWIPAAITVMFIASATSDAVFAQAARDQLRDKGQSAPNQPSQGQSSQSQSSQGQSTQRIAAKPPAKPSATKTHKLAIQVNENRPEVMNLALNNARNVLDHFKGKGEKVEIEIVAFGPGLHMLREDTSPVKQRVAEMSLADPSVKFIACGNTQANHEKAEQKPITLVSEAKVQPSGVVRLMELQAQGYAYVRP